MTRSLLAWGAIAGAALLMTGAAVDAQGRLRTNQSQGSRPIQLRPQTGGNSSPGLGPGGQLAPFGMGGPLHVPSAAPTPTPSPLGQPVFAGAYNNSFYGGLNNPGSFGGFAPYNSFNPYGPVNPYGAFNPYGPVAPYGPVNPYGAFTPYSLNPYGAFPPVGALPYGAANPYGFSPGVFGGFYPYGF